MALKAPGILRTAALLLGQRAPQRDKETGERTMRRAVMAFNELEGTDLTESQGWKFMQVLKMARSSQGELNIDDYVDGAAYAALAGEAASAEAFEPRNGPFDVPGTP